MTDFRSQLTQLQRPRLLIRAARLGVPDFRRERDLGRLIGTHTPPPPQVSMARLLEAEDELEDCRRSGSSSYSPMRHIDILIALMAEAQLLPRPQAAR
jgi:hypothetical protein